VIKLYQTFHDQVRLYFLLEYLPNGSIQDLIQRETVLSLKLTKYIAAEIVLALQDLRRYEVIHRDLKPGNIMFDHEYHIKIIDFATSLTHNPKVSAKIPKRPNKPIYT
jgi:serine/threonine protein kinase